MTCKKFRDSAWGFVIYRCSQGNETAWNSLLQALRSNLQEILKIDMREDLLEFHDLHVIDDKTLYGATSHEVRDHFKLWVLNNLKERLRPGATSPEHDLDWIDASDTPRYNYCLFVDNICLESLDYPGWNSPVVKILCKKWESPFPVEERNYAIPAPFHDGATEYDEEDVGWMYMPLNQYLDKYTMFNDWEWEDQYVRPPYIDYTEDESNMVGHWRKKLLDGGSQGASESAIS